MIVRKFKSVPFSIELKKPFKNSNVEISKRQGFIIKITDETGNIGYGEVSPLPGSSEETFESVIPIISELKERLIDSELDSDVFQSLEKYPSVEFGFSQALHSIFILRNGFNTDWRINSTILVNGIIGMMPKSEAMNKAKKIIAAGFKTIKVKIGRKNIEDDIDLIKSIFQNFSSDIKYRLDANGKWDIDKALYAVEHLENTNVEYLEQPVKSSDELIELSKISKIPIAADESIRSTDDVKRFLAESNIQYFVLKPSIMGSIIETIDLINLIEGTNRNVIISSAFESSIGRSALVFLSSLVKNDLAHGLAVTAPYFSNDVAEDAYPIVNRKINFDEKRYPPKFNFIKSS